MDEDLKVATPVSPDPLGADEETEQVIGVIEYCSVCDERTVHVDGVCRDHKVVRRRKQVVASAANDIPVRTRKRKPAPKSGGGGRVLGFLLLGAAIVGMGEVHIVRGTGGTHVCRKDGFSLSNTLVNIDELRAAKTPNVALLRTLDKCQLPPAAK